MKSFFKKLSLVLAAAMIITLIPAQQTKAAGATLVYTEQAEKDKTKAITYKTLKVGETVDLKVWNATDWKTNGKGWVSSEQGVATVDKTGLVKAIAVGTTEVIYDCAGHDQQPVLIQVVGDYTVDIVNQDKNNEKVTAYTLEKVGDKVDFGFLGAKGYTVSKFACNWASSDKKIATVDNKGVVTAVAAGTATISLTITEKATGKVAFAVKPVDVTVKGATVAEVKFEQKSLNTAKVSLGLGKDGKEIFPEKVESLELSLVIDGVDCHLEILGYDKSTGILKVENDFENGETYKIAYTVDKETSVDSFKANVGKLAGFKIAYSTVLDENAAEAQNSHAYVGLTTVLKATDFVDANGLGTTMDGYMIEFFAQNLTDKTDAEPLNNADPTLTFNEKGEKIRVTAKLTNVENENDVINAEPIIITAEAVPDRTILASTVDLRVGQNKAYDKASSVKDAHISTEDGASWGVALTFKDNYGVEYKLDTGKLDTNETLNEIGYFTLSTSQPKYVGVTDNGDLEAREVGSAKVTVNFNYIKDDKVATVQLASSTITVTGTRLPKSISVVDVDTTMKKDGTNKVSISDSYGANAFNEFTLKFKVLDGNQDPMSLGIDGLEFSYDADLFYAPYGYEYDGKTGVMSVKFQAKDIEDETNDNGEVTKAVSSKLNNKITVKGVKYGTKTSSAATFYASVYNYDTTSKSATVVKNEPYIFVAEKTGLGNTDLGNADGIPYVDFVFAEVKKFTGANASVYVYGGELTGYEVKNYTELSNLSGASLSEKISADVAAANNATKSLIYVAVNNGSKNLKNSDSYDKQTETLMIWSNGSGVRVNVRKSFNQLLDAQNGTDAQVKLNKVADIVSKDLKRSYTVTVYKPVKGTTLYSASLCKTVMSSTAGKCSVEIKNGDADAFAFKVELTSTTYEGHEVPDLTTFVVGNSNIYFKTYTLKATDKYIQVLPVTITTIAEPFAYRVPADAVVTRGSRDYAKFTIYELEATEVKTYTDAIKASFTAHAISKNNPKYIDYVDAYIDFVTPTGDTVRTKVSQNIKRALSQKQ